MRIYLVRTSGEPSAGGPVRFVRAANQAAAIRTVVAERFTASVASAEDIYRASKTGQLEILDASPADARDAANPETGADSLAARAHNSRMPLQ